MARSSFLTNLRQDRIYWVLVAYLCIIFLMGGGQRADMQSLVIIRPLALFVCAYGLWTLTREQVRHYRFLFLMAGACFALVGIHLIPLPPSLWSLLPGREIVTQIDAAAGLGEVWRPITLVPASGRNAFFSMFVPLAALILAVQLDRDALFRLLPVIIIIAVVSGVLGIFQIASDPKGPLQFHRLGGEGTANGFFANRNHQAALLACLFPMLAVFAWSGVRSYEKSRFNITLALLGGVVLIPLLLVTGSRAGFILGVIGLCCVPLLYAKPRIEAPKKRKVQKINQNYIFGGLAAIFLALSFILMSRSEAFDRLTQKDASEDLRFKILPNIIEIIVNYFPVGSGAGSFVEVYAMHEMDEQLGPKFMNRAHNDIAEVVMTLGLPGAILLIIAIIAYVLRLFNIRGKLESGTRERGFAFLGATIIAFLFAASILDYPLRVPSMICFFTIACVWMAGPFDKNTKRDGKKPSRSLKIEKAKILGWK
jgi:O-antigen ligase